MKIDQAIENIPKDDIILHTDRPSNKKALYITIKHE